MTPESIARIESSFAALAPRGTALTARFYERLFVVAPDVRPLFPADLEKQQMKLLESISVVVSHIRELDKVAPALMEMGARHAAYGAEPAHYGVVRDCLIATMAELAGDSWAQAIEDDWVAAVDLIAETMLSGVGAR